MTGLALALFLTIANCGFSARHLVVASSAMSPTIEPGDHCGTVGFNDNGVLPINRFDIVTCRRPPVPSRGIDENTLFVYRVIGMPGDKVELKKGTVFVNGLPLDESSFRKVSSGDDRKEVEVPENEYFLMGDNRPNSEDSRYVGTFKRAKIDGIVSTIVRKADYENGKRW